MSDDDREPFDEQAFLQLLERLDIEILADPGMAQLAHAGRKLLAENIRLRNAERVARERLLLLEQGQTLLPLSPTTDTNHHPQHLCHEDKNQDQTR